MNGHQTYDGKDYIETMHRKNHGMDQLKDLSLSRRHLLLGAGAATLFPTKLIAAPSPTVSAVPKPLMQRAIAAMERHRGSLTNFDRIAIADFSRPSRSPRFHIVDMVSGKSNTLLVAHGRGSDPAHKGWLERFSNEDGSNASSSGAYATGDIYVGQHGRSRRLQGLEPTNSNAERRAIVIHAAAYVSPNIAAMQGKLGRSQGCFAFSSSDIDDVLEALGPGRLLYADRLSA